MPVSNPIDLWPAAEVIGGEAYNRAVEIIIEDPGVDLLLIETFVGNSGANLDLDTMAFLSKANQKPIFFWVVGMQKPIMDFRKRAQALGMPVYREISRAVEAIHAVYSNGKRRREGGLGKFPVSRKRKMRIRSVKLSET